MKTLRLRHYGASKYDPAKFAPIKDQNWVKPLGGLWTSPVDSEYGWCDWCDEESFRDCDVYFDVEFTGKALTIDGILDLEDFKWQKASWSYYPSFEDLVTRGFDAVHLTDRGQSLTRYSEPYDLYGWDCETVLVLNKNCLKEI